MLTQSHLYFSLADFLWIDVNRTLVSSVRQWYIWGFACQSLRSMLACATHTHTHTHLHVLYRFFLSVNWQSHWPPAPSCVLKLFKGLQHQASLLTSKEKSCHAAAISLIKPTFVSLNLEQDLHLHSLQRPHLLSVPQVPGQTGLAAEPLRDLDVFSTFS
jgi:hypothetical protein